MVVALVAFLNALIAGENPVEKLGEPSLQGLRVLLGEGFGTFQQLNAIEHLDKRIGIDDSITASLAIVKAGHNLSMVEIRVHAGFLVQEPHTQQLYSLLGITFVTAEVPSQRKRGYACCHFRQLRTVQTLQLWIRNAVATDVWESVGLRLVGPEVATQAHIVVFVAAGSSLLLHHHRKRSLLHAIVGLFEQMMIGCGISPVVQMLPHFGEVRLVPNGLCTSRSGHDKK